MVAASVALEVMAPKIIFSRLRMLALVVLLMGLSACDLESVPQPFVRHSNDPSGRYQLSVVLPPELRSVAVIKAQSHYEITNSEQCVPIDKTKAIGGIRPRFVEMIDFRLKKITDDKLSGIFYENVIESSDYYGLGECRWKLVGLDVRLVGLDVRLSGVAEITFFPAFYDLLKSKQMVLVCRESIRDGARIVRCLPSTKIHGSSFDKDFTILITLNEG